MNDSKKNISGSVSYSEKLIRLAMHKLSVNISGLAELTGVPRSSISNILQGAAKEINLSHALLIMQAAKISRKELE